jgi:hypothetical protein
MADIQMKEIDISSLPLTQLHEVYIELSIKAHIHKQMLALVLTELLRRQEQSTPPMI